MNRLRVRFVLVSAVISFFLCQHAGAATRTAASCSQVAVQEQVNLAVNGDIVQIPAGSCTWTSPVTWTDKNISVMGAGIGQTVINISGPALVINMTTGAPWTSSVGTPGKSVSWRLSGMTLTGTYNVNTDHPVYIHSEAVPVPVYGWRMDHMELDFPVVGANDTSGGELVEITGLTWGLIDHCTFNHGSSIAIQYQAFVQADWQPGSWVPYKEGNLSWSMPLNFGSEEALYVEDCTFTSLTKASKASAIDMHAGASIVFRHNTLTACSYTSHQTEWGFLDRGGSKKWEVYNNAFDGTQTGTSTLFVWPMQIQENGTGVIFDNTVTHFSTPAWEMSVDRVGISGGDWSTYPNTAFGPCVGVSNRLCTAKGTPYPCCTGIGTGTCGSAVTNLCTGNQQPYLCCTGAGTGTCSQYDGNAEPTGWPCLDQIGRGPHVGQSLVIGPQNQPSVPVRAWNNGPQKACSDPSAGDGPCDGSVGVSGWSGCHPLNYPATTINNYIRDTSDPHSNGDVDICNGGTTMPTKCGNFTGSYASYVYPHPLQSGTDSVPSPTGVHLVQ